MRFRPESATGVPRRQRANLPVIQRSAWSPGRTLRGWPTTALLAWLLLGQSPAALAQPTARFSDASTDSASRTSGSGRPAAPESPMSAPTATPPTATPPTATPPPPSEGWSRRLALTHFERGAREERSGDITQALREYTESLAIDSTLGEAYLRLGALRERMGDPREAELVYTEATRRGDARARAFWQRSRLLRAEGRSDDAIRDLENAVALEADADSLAELAHHYVEAHAFAAALFTFRRILAYAQNTGNHDAIETARLEVRALSVLAAETDLTGARVPKHDWVGRSLVSIARH